MILSYCMAKKNSQFQGKGQFFPEIMPVFPFTVSGADYPVYSTDLQQHYTLPFLKFILSHAQGYA